MWYIAVQIGKFIAAAKGSLIWVCVHGFFMIDEVITITASWIVKDRHKRETCLFEAIVMAI